MSHPVPTEQAFTVLLVCTGNICRSALAERLGRAYLDEVLGEHASAVRIVSAGTQAVVGSAMHPDSALVLQGFGGDPSGFVARQLDDAIALDADLTLTMTRGHRAEVLRVAPRSLSRTFTLREAADLVGLVDDAPAAGTAFAQRARDLTAAMAAVRSKRSNGDGDDVPDPIGRPVEFHQEVGELVAGALIGVLDRLVVLHDTNPAATAAPSSEDPATV